MRAPIPSNPEPQDVAAPQGLVPLTGGSTDYFRKVFPMVWSTGVGALTVAVWMDLLGDAPAPPMVKWALLAVWGGVSTLLFHVFGKLRRVWRDGDELLVGDPLRGLRIHLSEVREIKESHFQQVKTVTLKLRRPTPLGDSITFVPRGAGPVFFPLATSAIAEDLRERHKALAAREHRLIGDG